MPGMILDTGYRTHLQALRPGPALSLATARVLPGRAWATVELAAGKADQSVYTMHSFMIFFFCNVKFFFFQCAPVPCPVFGCKFLLF